MTLTLYPLGAWCFKNLFYYIYYNLFSFVFFFLQNLVFPVKFYHGNSFAWTSLTISVYFRLGSFTSIFLVGRTLMIIYYMCLQISKSLKITCVITVHLSRLISAHCFLVDCTILIRHDINKVIDIAVIGNGAEQTSFQLWNGQDWSWPDHYDPWCSTVVALMRKERERKGERGRWGGEGVFDHREFHTKDVIEMPFVKHHVPARSRSHIDKHCYNLKLLDPRAVRSKYEKSDHIDKKKVMCNIKLLHIKLCDHSCRQRLTNRWPDYRGLRAKLL